MVIFILQMKKLMLKKFESLPRGETVVDRIACWFLRPLELWPQAYIKKAGPFTLLSCDSCDFALPPFSSCYYSLCSALWGLHGSSQGGVYPCNLSYSMLSYERSELNALKGSSGHSALT